MRKQVVFTLMVVFFIIHLSIILSQAIQSTVNGYMMYHYNRSLSIPLFSLLAHNKYNEPYLMLAGTDTGYGFYGIKTSTEKIFRATYLQPLGGAITADLRFNLKTSNGLARLRSYASYIATLLLTRKK